MSNNYYFYKGNKYIVYEDGIKKIINNKGVSLNPSELAEIEEFIKSANPSIFASPKLMEIASRNPELVRIDVVPEILKKIELYLPVEARDTFYENLETISFKVAGINNKNDSIGSEVGYNSVTNSIRIKGSDLQFMKDMCELWGAPEGEYLRFIRHALTHELLHMASRKKEGSKIYTGFITHPTEDELEANIPLNEALTEIMASIIFPCEISDNTSSYSSYIALGIQIGMLLGGKFLENSYFLNKGTKPLVEELDKIEYLPEKAECLLYTIATSDLADNRCEELCQLLSAQDMLLDYYKAKLRKCLEDGDFESIRVLMNTLNNCFLDESIYGKYKIALSPECKNLLAKNKNKFNKILSIYNEFIPCDEKPNQKEKK